MFEEGGIIRQICKSPFSLRIAGVAFALFGACLPSMAAKACLPDDPRPVSVTPVDDKGVFRDVAGDLYFAAEIHLGANGSTSLSDELGSQPSYSALSLGPANRWGRWPAWIVRTTDERAHNLQAALLESGQAIYMPRLSKGPCADYLRQQERKAEQSGNGYWGEGKRFLVYSSAFPDDVLEAAGAYAIVRGRIVSLGKTRSTRYLNFGRYWKKDFTVTLANDVADEVLSGLAEDGLSFDDLDGRAVEIRGVIEERDGPLIDWRRTEQLVVLKE